MDGEVDFGIFRVHKLCFPLCFTLGSERQYVLLTFLYAVGLYSRAVSHLVNSRLNVRFVS